MAKLPNLFGKLIGKYGDDVADVARYGDDALAFGRKALDTKPDFDSFISKGVQSDTDFLNARNSFNSAISDLENLTNAPTTQFDYTPDNVFTNSSFTIPTRSTDDIIADTQKNTAKLDELLKKLENMFNS